MSSKNNIICLEQDIHTIKQRFFRVNQGRYQRCLDQLSFKQQFILETISLLFHINHSFLPGFVDESTPCGFHGFKPTIKQVDSLKSFNRNFNYSPKFVHDADLCSLFVMGSCGSIAQNSQSDLDFWLIHKQDIPAQHIYNLEQKAEKIESWAEKFNLEVHFFIMSAEDFKAKKVGKLSSEHSGSAQHLLLLDEFYRSCILICGSYPVWWLVPCDKELEYEQYVKSLNDKGSLGYRETIDLGSTMPLAIEELYGASVWQLCKAIDSPYKSILKSILLEYYVQENHELILLSQEFKQRIHQNTINLNQLDAYLLLYEMVENYYKRTNQTQRLSIFRKSIYLKLNLKLSISNSKVKNWRRSVISELIENWQWTADDIKTLDNRAQWSIQNILNEKKSVLNELSYCHRLLSKKCHKQNIKLSDTDLNILSRKLYSVFDKKNEKIDLINPGICKDVTHCNTYIYEVKTKKTQQSIWSVYEHPIDINSEKLPTPIKRSFSLVDIWLWLYMNGLFIDNKHIGFSSSSHQIDKQKQSQLYLIFNNHIQPFNKRSKHEEFESKSSIKNITILINALNEPLAELSQKGLLKLSHLNDSFNFSAQHDNLIETIDIIIQNSWNETYTFHFESQEALAQCIKHYLNIITDNHNWVQPSIHVGCNTQNQYIQERFESLFLQIRHSFFQQNNSQFILNIRSFLTIISKQDGKYFVENCKHEVMLFDFLNNNKIKSTQIYFEKKCSEKLLTPKLNKLHQTDSITVFIEHISSQILVYIIDESDHILRYKSNHTNFTTLIKSLDQFIYNTKNNATHTFTEFYKIEYNLKETLIHPVQVPDNVLMPQPFDVNIFLDKDAHQNLIYSININDKQFHSFDYDESVFSKAAEYLITLRTEKASYWIYINSLALSNTLNNANDSTVYYLKHKLSIEQRLNQAIEIKKSLNSLE
ncbi:class I adenylate cyclase [Marinicellulosiphila megalodicopiae]|uniref:class I adenylate cyclase n=1 Tax=Marinicellulosiphila megalodicopiae TaxID=2724896 RepID=UPI003BB03FB1